jgi:hypothetical protein
MVAFHHRINQKRCHASIGMWKVIGRGLASDTASASATSCACAQSPTVSIQKWKLILRAYWSIIRKLAPPKISRYMVGLDGIETIIISCSFNLQLWSKYWFIETSGYVARKTQSLIAHCALYSCIALLSYHKLCFQVSFEIQWNHSNLDTIGTVLRHPPFRGYYYNVGVAYC